MEENNTIEGKKTQALHPFLLLPLQNKTHPFLQLQYCVSAFILYFDNGLIKWTRVIVMKQRISILLCFKKSYKLILKEHIFQ